MDDHSRYEPFAEMIADQIMALEDKRILNKMVRRIDRARARLRVKRKTARAARRINR